ncbi:MAG: aminopeptidase [Tannerellaceae bacterium]|nr:aminopeptidase [Tannerellaceae bacterium]
MKRTIHFLLLLFLFTTAVYASDSELGKKLAALSGISQIEELKSDHYTEKYVVHITQPLDHMNPEAGSFTQRVVISHAGFDRPTVLVTEGYGGAYALRPAYQEELARLFHTNIVFVEHRYFLDSTPEPLNWNYLTAENSAYDLHQVRNTFQTIYPDKWISTGISKGGQTTLIYRSYFPDDVDFSVPYVAPLNRAVEDTRHQEYLQQVGTEEEREQIRAFQREILKRRAAILPLLEEYVKEKQMEFRISLDEVLDYAVLEYPFALWQWGTPVTTIPALSSEDKMLFHHLIDISGPDYFSENQPYGSFFVQAARELGYYSYDTQPLEEYLSISTSEGYVNRIMLPAGTEPVEFSDALYWKVYHYLKDNDPKMILIYGEVDPWSATRVPDFEGKKNMQIYIEPGGSHRARISTLPEDMQEQVIGQIQTWLAE